MKRRLRGNNMGSKLADGRYEFEEWTFLFAKKVILFCKNLPRNSINRCLIDQLVRSSASVGANYREANDSLGGKDFIYRLKVARKEAKEASYWMRLVSSCNQFDRKKMVDLLEETREIRCILTSIINKCSR